MLGAENDLRLTNAHKPYDQNTTTILRTGYSKVESMDYMMNKNTVWIFWSSTTTKTIQRFTQSSDARPKRSADYVALDIVRMR